MAGAGGGGRPSYPGPRVAWSRGQWGRSEKISAWLALFLDILWSPAQAGRHSTAPTFWASSFRNLQGVHVDCRIRMMWNVHWTKFVMWYNIGFGRDKVQWSTGAKVGTDGKQLLVIRRSRWSVDRGHIASLIIWKRLLLNVQMVFVSRASQY